MRPGAVRRVEDMRRPSGRVVSRWSVHEPTKREKKKKKRIVISLLPRPHQSPFRDIASRTAARPSRSPASPDARDGPRGVPYARADRADGRGPRGNARRGTNPARARRWRWFVPRWRRRGSWRTRARPPFPRGSRGADGRRRSSVSPMGLGPARGRRERGASRRVHVAGALPRRPLPGKRRCRVVVGFFG